LPARSSSGCERSLRSTYVADDLDRNFTATNLSRTWTAIDTGVI